MRASEARHVMERHDLIPRTISRRILKALSDPWLPSADIYDFIDQDEFAVLRDEYRKKLEMVQHTDRGDIDPSLPRNTPVYLMLEDIIPGFNWRILSNQHKQGARRVAIDAPLVSGIRPSLASMLAGAVKTNSNSTLHNRYNCAHDLPSEVVDSLAILFATGNIQFPSENHMARVVDWVKKGLSGKPVTVVTPICPDYAVDEVSKGLFRFTFDGLNKKIGVVGRRYLDKILIIDDVLTGLGFAVRYIAAIGDFEAFVPDNCARVGLSEENFIKRLRRSQIEMARALPVSAETPLFTEIGAGKSEWMGYFVKVLQDFGAQEFGESGLSVKEVEAIGLSRRVLYDRWYGDKAKQIGYQQIALNQGAEYATMGAMILANLENPLVLGADHAKMAPFYSATAAVPVLYLRNNYVGVS